MAAHPHTFATVTFTHVIFTRESQLYSYQAAKLTGSKKSFYGMLIKHSRRYSYL